MNNRECQKLIDQLLSDCVVSSEISGSYVYVEINAENLLRILTILATSSTISFSSLFDLFAVDYRKKYGHICLYYHLHSFKIDKSIFVSAKVQEKSKVQSATILFNNAEWYEREVFEKFGVDFINHPDLRPIFSEPAL